MWQTFRMDGSFWSQMPLLEAGLTEDVPVVGGRAAVAEGAGGAAAAGAREGRCPQAARIKAPRGALVDTATLIECLPRNSNVAEARCCVQTPPHAHFCGSVLNHAVNI